VLGIAAPSVRGAGGLTVDITTWDVIGLDSNSLTSGPDTFPLGVRVCNTTSTAITGVTSVLAWSTSNANVALVDSATHDLGTVNAGTCTDTYYTVKITRIAAARDSTRDYSVSATGSGGASGSISNRRITVERLVSQNRNTTQKISGAGGCNAGFTVCDPAPTDLVVGNEYTYKLYGSTSSTYEQLESFITFPGNIFKITSVSASYATPSTFIGSAPYADACNWQDNKTLANFNKCGAGNPDFASSSYKVGNQVVTTYRVLVIGTGSGSLSALFYDFSGSSFHYNSDYGGAGFSVSVTSKWPLDVTTVGDGTVTSSPTGIDCGTLTADCTNSYSNSTSVTLTATPGAGQTFTGWSGGVCSGSSPTCAVSMTEARSVTATFTGNTSYPLTVSVVGTGSVGASSGISACTTTGSANCSYTYAAGTNVTLTATAGTGQTFYGWSGDCSGLTTTCTVAMSQVRDVTATFGTTVSLTYPLYIETFGPGRVTSTKGEISCGALCTADYNSGTSIVLTATPDTGETFTGWGGGVCTGTSSTCTVTMSAARYVSATFSSRTLTTAFAGSGSGTLNSSPDGIACTSPSSCSSTFENNVVVTLTAAAASGSRFTGWSGTGSESCLASSLTCAVTMSADRTITATFVSAYTLTVTKVGGSTSTVSADVGPLSCASGCTSGTQTYDSGTVVTLTASAGSGYQFSGWSGAGCSSTGTCVITMASAKSVTATFVLAYDLTVTLETPASSTSSVTRSVPSGTVTSSCSFFGSDCVTYGVDTLVTLTALPQSREAFDGWYSGSTGSSRFSGCTTTGPCIVTMDAAKTVRAVFVTDASSVSLSVKKKKHNINTDAGEVEQANVGTVVSDVAGIDCGTSCSEASHGYSENTVVVLTQTPAAGYRFGYWSGKCSGSADTCTVTLGEVNLVEAVFIPIAQIDSSATGSGKGGITVKVAGSTDSDLACELPCTSKKSKVLDADTEVELTAVPDTSGTKSRFYGWLTEEGGTFPGCSNTTSCTMTLGESDAIVAKFVAIVPLTAEIVSVNGGEGTVSSTQNWALESVACVGSVLSGRCNNEYDLDELVTITATPDDGSIFVEWRDTTPVASTSPLFSRLFTVVLAPQWVSWFIDPVASTGCTTNPVCEVTMSQALTMEATFDTEPAATPTPTPTPDAPVCDTFSASALEGVAPHSVDFFGSAPSDTIDSWLWDFGDGETSTLQDPTHAFAAEGTYTVSLTVSGPGGSVQCTEARVVTVTAPDPSPDPSVTPDPSVDPSVDPSTDPSTSPEPSSDPSPDPSVTPDPSVDPSVDPSTDPSTSPEPSSEISPSPEPSDPGGGVPSTNRSSGGNQLSLALLQLAALLAAIGLALRQRAVVPVGKRRPPRR